MLFHRRLAADEPFGLGLKLLLLSVPIANHIQLLTGFRREPRQLSRLRTLVASKYGLDAFSKPEIEPQNFQSERIIRQGAFGIRSCLASWDLSAWITIETKKQCETN